MLSLVPREIENYCSEHSEPESSLLTQLVQETHQRTELPQMLVGHLEGAILRLLVRLTGARRVLEIGTFTGYSALAMAEGLPQDGRLITCDINPDSTAIAQSYWDQSPHGAKIELRRGPALDTIAALEGSLDLVFIDADKENYINYWQACLPKVRPGGLLVADNVLWSGRVLNPQAASDHAIAAFNRHVQADDRVESVMLPVRDGMFLAWKR